jgi:hypothetical protein
VDWIIIGVRGLFYTLLIVTITPVLFLFRIDERKPNVDDGLDMGYDDGPDE